jgi:hypothetical protein
MPVLKTLASPKVFIPVGVVVLAGVSYHFAKKRDETKKTALTPERKAVYEGALTSLKNPDELRKMADSFESVGLPEHATVLRKRAHLHELPPEIQKRRKEEFQFAMSHHDPNVVLKYADAFSDSAAFSAANHLRKYAGALASNDVDVIQRTILDLERFTDGNRQSAIGNRQESQADGRQPIAVRSIAHQNAVRNLRERMVQLDAGARPLNREAAPSPTHPHER